MKSGIHFSESFFHRILHLHLHFSMKYLLLFLWIYASTVSFAQSGSIEGKVLDGSGEGLIGAIVQLIDNSQKPIGIGASTDIDGNFKISSLNPGIYNLKFSMLGKSTIIRKGVKVLAKKVVRLNVTLVDDEKCLKEVIVIATKKTFIGDKPSGIVSSDLQTNIQVRRVSDISSATPGVFKKDNGKGISIRGCRVNSVEYYIDGVKVTGVPTLTMRKDVLIEREDLIRKSREENLVEEKFKDTKKQHLSTFSIDVDKSAYTLLRKTIEDGLPIAPSQIHIEEMLNYFDYKYEQPKNGEVFNVETELGFCPWNPAHKLLKIGVQGKQVSSDTMPLANIVLLIDVSGSMYGSDRLDRIKLGLTKMVEKLRKEDKVSIVVYAGAAGLVLPPTTGDQKQLILGALNTLSAGGSTAGGAGIHLAYSIAQQEFIKGGNNRIILCTDGDFNVGVSGEEELIQLIEEKRKSGVFLSVFGVGVGNYQFHSMEQMADHGNGVSYFIDSDEEAISAFEKDFSSGILTIAKDVKLQFAFNPSKVESYRLIGYDNRRLANEDFANDVRDAGDLGAGSGVTALYELVLKEQGSIQKVSVMAGDSISEIELSGSELGALCIRYKNPTDSNSILKINKIAEQFKGVDEISKDFKFAASVAGLGLILQKSKYKGLASLEMVKLLATSGIDGENSDKRKGFVELIGKLEKQFAKR